MASPFETYNPLASRYILHVVVFMAIFFIVSIFIYFHWRQRGSGFTMWLYYRNGTIGSVKSADLKLNNLVSGSCLVMAVCNCYNKFIILTARQYNTTSTTTMKQVGDVLSDVLGGEQFCGKDVYSPYFYTLCKWWKAVLL